MDEDRKYEKSTFWKTNETTSLFPSGREAFIKQQLINRKLEGENE